MAVLDQSYRRWNGRAAGYARRVLVIPHYDLLEILQKRTWLLAWLACLVPPLVLGGLVYLATNLQTLKALIPSLPLEMSLPAPGNVVYRGFLQLQCWLLTAFAVLVGPPLATRDFANGAMPLYLSKSLRRWDYVLGRCAVLAGLLSLASWIPYLLIFALEWGMTGPSWRDENADLPLRIVGGVLPTVLLLTLLIVAVGAVVHRANLARAALLFLLLGIKPLMFPLEEALDAPRVRVLSPTDVTGTLRDAAFEEASPAEQALAPPPAPAGGGDETLRWPTALVALFAWLGAAVALVARRVRPVEVVK